MNGRRRIGVFFALLAFAWHVASGTPAPFDPLADAGSICSAAAPRGGGNVSLPLAPAGSQHASCPSCDAHCGGVAIVGHPAPLVPFSTPTSSVPAPAWRAAPTLAWTTPRSRAPPLA